MIAEPAPPEDNSVQGKGDPSTEWWQDSSMPWRQKPGKSDIACLVSMGVVGVFSLLMLPLRAWLLGSADRIPALVALTGSRSGSASLGALARVGDYSVVWHVGAQTIYIPWAIPMIAGVLMSIKFDWVYWWAGKLWGRGMIEVWAGKSERARRRYSRVERWAKKSGWVGMFIAYVPIPLPIMAVVFVLAGASKMSLRKFILLDALVCSLWNLFYFGLGWLIGSPITNALAVYNKFANYVTIALVVVIIGGSIASSFRKARSADHA